MSRTTRRVPAWVYTDIQSRNDYINGYRGVRYGSFGNWDTALWKDHNDSFHNEQNAWVFGTDNARRPLWSRKRGHNSVPGYDPWFRDGGDAHSAESHRYYRRQWARANRRYSKAIVQEALDEFYADPEPHQWFWQEDLNELYEYYFDDEDLYQELDWLQTMDDVSTLNAA